MKTSDYVAIAIGLAAGYFLIQYLGKKNSTQPAAAANQQPAAMPDWAARDKTLSDIWSGNWATVTDNSGNVWTTN